MDIAQYPFNNEIPQELWPLLDQRDGAPKTIAKLKEMYSLASVAHASPEQRAWECTALFYRDTGRFHQAIQVISALYEQLIAYQIGSDSQVHKGMSLVWLRDFHLSLVHLVTAKRYAMLTLCEDAIREQGTINAQQGGIYFRLAFEHGMADDEIARYAHRIFEVSQGHPVESRYPEWLLQELDNDWIVECPTLAEAFIYTPNRYYIKHLLDNLEEPTGKTLERLADYILSSIPGFRIYRRQRTPSTDYDIVCSVEGLNLDFRAELGRYFICECKDWSRSVDFTTIAKFCRVLDSTKCKSGILFSRDGISGAAKGEDAEREQMKVFQDRGMVILVIDRADLDAVEVVPLVVGIRPAVE
ncbi:MAG: restriction endonuclease [Planctomycetes bacterium]|nr:restriction endonuclease [Planctomycetota bacterium]